MLAKSKCAAVEAGSCALGANRDTRRRRGCAGWSEFLWGLETTGQMLQGMESRLEQLPYSLWAIRRVPETPLGRAEPSNDWRAKSCTLIIPPALLSGALTWCLSLSLCEGFLSKGRFCAHMAKMLPSPTGLTVACVPWFVYRQGKYSAQICNAASATIAVKRALAVGRLNLAETKFHHHNHGSTAARTSGVRDTDPDRGLQIPNLRLLFGLD